MKVDALPTEERYEAQWEKYDQMFPHYEEIFLNSVAPLTPETFVGKEVCDAGCGMGRYSYWPLKYGAKSLFAFDKAPQAVASARKTLREFPQATVVEKSIYELEDCATFDICFSIGVIHHLAYPREAVRRLIRALKPGGQLILWVYGAEGNLIPIGFHQLFQPLLRLLPPALRKFLAYFLATFLYFILKLFPWKSPATDPLKSLPFPHLHYVVDDVFAPSIVRFYKREEINQLLEDCGLGDTQIYRRRRNWTVIGTKLGLSRI